ncbi:uncharacterized protein LOC131605409 [Vicia villosa]|uniref:uncharacterized protein LOC131605409 n=1 Tax=Vicia villosa TaxID=3911 RepID=UPI00273CD54C|nr:uncharacterized protein LOC131605409 [Vicia villosa]
MAGRLDGLWRWGSLGISNATVGMVAAETAGLMRELENCVPAAAVRDSTVWLPTAAAAFTVSSCYAALCKMHIPYGPPGAFDMSYKSIWRVDVPLKIRAFGWKCFVNRIPSKVLLLKRGILSSNSNIACVFCGSYPESSVHLLLDCCEAELVWKEIAIWLGTNNCKANDFKESFSSWYNSCRKLNIKKGKAGGIWLAIIWSLWLCRNEIIFKDGAWNVRDVVWGCKALLWRWSFIGNITHHNYNFYEFSKNPLLYLA